MKVSVIIPNYNHALYLRQRIESVLAQTFQNFEVILLDDCSTDDSRSIISKYAGNQRIKIELNEKNSGTTFKQWKKGMECAKGEYIWIAESDDYADARFLERLVRVLDENPEITFAYCRSWIVNEKGEIKRFADSYLTEIDARRWTADFLADGREACQAHFVHANSVPNASAVLFRKSAYDRVGGVDETLRVSGDWKLWVCLALQGKIAYLGEPLNYYREHQETVRSKMEQNARGAGEHLGMVRWMLERVTPTPEILEKAFFVASCSWIPALLSRQLSLHERWKLFRTAVASDPHALRRLIRPTLVAARMKIALEFRQLRQRFEGRAS